MKTLVHDNFLPQQDFLNLKNTVLNIGNFPWYVSKVLNEPELNHSEYNFQLCHVFYAGWQAPSSEYFSLLNPILKKLDPFALVRLKANLTTKTEKIVEQGYHTDFDDNTSIVTGVYYLNTNDGYTKFKKTGKVVDSVENRLVLFDSRLEHTGTTCTDADFRCVLNLNYVPWAEEPTL
jgi:hypothetical protein